MKRSEINAIIAAAEADFQRVGYALPAFGRWSAAEWARAGEKARKLIASGHGWDVTDYGSGDFAKRGLLLFTVRNGTLEGGEGNRPYAEKIMISRQNQVAPMHRHNLKIEDIINRAPLADDATLAIELYESDASGQLDKEKPVVAHLDGVATQVPPGTIVYLRAGESITLYPGTFHAFWGEGGDVVIGEVSTVNDDHTDNVFVEPIPRFSDIEEDEAIYRPLVNDHPA